MIIETYLHCDEMVKYNWTFVWNSFTLSMYIYYNLSYLIVDLIMYEKEFYNIHLEDV